jgi:hypothetical protein
MASKNIYEHTEYDSSTGEVTSRRVLKKTAVNVEQFTRTYIADIAAMLRCSSAQVKVVVGVLKYLEYDTNNFILVKERREEICKLTGMKLSTFNCAVSRLKAKNIFVGISANVYCLNPKLFFYGSDLGRHKVFSLQIDYTIKDNGQIDKG